MGRSRAKTTGALAGGRPQQTRPSSGDDGDEEMEHWNEHVGGSDQVSTKTTNEANKRTDVWIEL